MSSGKSNLVKDFNLAAPDGMETSDGGKTVTVDGKKYEQKAGMTSILILGHDSRQDEGLNGQADFFMVMAIDTETGKISLISLPRDTMAQINRTYDYTDEYLDTQTAQIATAFAYGSDFEHAAQNVCDVVSTLLYNIPMNYFYVLDINGIGTLANAVGGVEVVSLEDVAKTDFKKGETYNLTGEDARKYVVERDCHVEGSSFDRLERQKQFIRAYLDKLMSVAKTNPGVIMDTVNALDSYSITNLGMPEFTYLASVLLANGVGDLQITSLSGEYIHNDETGYAEYWLDKDNVFQTILDVYYQPVS